MPLPGAGEMYAYSNMNNWYLLFSSLFLTEHMPYLWKQALQMLVAY